MSLLPSLALNVVMASCGISVHAATYEVAQRNPHASDDGPGSADQPWKTLAQAAEKVRAGDLVVIHGGLYREQVVVGAAGRLDAPIRFEAAPGEQVVLTGADQLVDWKRTDGDRPVYSTPWAYQFSPRPDTIVGHCEQVMIDGYLLHQVFNTGQLAPGSFFADTTNKLLYVWDTAGRNLNQAFAEASTRPEILRLAGDCLEIRGLRFRFAANHAQHGAVVLAGDHDLMEDCVVEQMNGSGAAFQGQQIVVRRCVFRDNGQMGFGAKRAHHLLFTDCLVENNNTKSFNRGWEAGGDKIVLTRDATFEQSRFVRNRGSGIWFDIGNENCVVDQCLIADNEDAGIFCEISYGLHAHDNVIIGNGLALTMGGWGAQGGICLSSSPNCVLERNLILGNREGLSFREQFRTTSTIDGQHRDRAVWNHDETIRGNLIVFNQVFQIRGWFDTDDNRPWPAKDMGVNGSGTSTPKLVDLAQGYAVTNSVTQPRALTLEQLQLHLEDNIYFAAPGQGWFAWGVDWKRHESYATLIDFQSALGIDKGSQTFDPQFAGIAQRDFRVTPEILSRLKESYPRSTVPEVTLGVR
jgi:hypothetical protein